MTESATLKKAGFTVTSGPHKGLHLEVHFNPVSLQYSVSNTMPQQTGERRQFVATSSAKLTMDLIFDTTLSGNNVRGDTGKLARLMKPSRQEHHPPVVDFEWGAFKFRGMLETYRETLDFFSPDGVPLRASVNLTLADQEHVFDTTTDPKLKSDVVSLPPSDDARGTTGLGTTGGDPAAGPALAALNQLESMRFPSGPLLAAGGGTPLLGPVAFASGGDGITGDFAGLRAQADSQRPFSLDATAFSTPAPLRDVATDSSGVFAVGGRALVEGSAGLSTDVGAADVRPPRIRFEAD